MTRPRTLSDILTPALIVDVPAMDRNIARMAAFFAAGPCKLRPHFKAHKTPEIARRQLAAGSCTGITCATVLEAEAVSSLCDDILIANEIIDPELCVRAAALALHGSTTIAVDSLEGIRAISHAAATVGSTVGILVDVNVGQNRCGVSPGADAVALGQRVTDAPSLRLRGVMGYEGHAVGIHDRAEREAETRRSMELLVLTASMFRDAGLSTEIVSTGGTGTFDIDSAFPAITEVQAGSYALMDTDYGKLGLPFEYASYVMGTVISRPAADRCVADCGHKSCTKDHGHPDVKDINGATVTALNDEHAVISLPPGSTISIGDRIFLIPSHTDPTLNLHDVVYAVDGDRVIDVWKVARGYQNTNH
jgi:D-serine deaminase-like pyridoxal phosphate-dependent protein